MRPIVSIVGRPNVGKSTLFNRIIGKRVAIVEAKPGVTRDRHYRVTSINNKEFLLVDTGGIEFTGDDSMADEIRKQAEMAIEESDIILFLMDSINGLDSTDEEIANILRVSEKPVLYVANKIDGDSQEQNSLQFYKIGAETIHMISAKSNYKIREFFQVLSDKIPASTAPAEVQNTDIPQVCVLGRPNAGKSTLINQILGEERLITSSIPGTTRDAIDTIVKHDDRDYLFIDTAGIRRRGKIERGVEHFSTIRAVSSLIRSNIAILVVDGKAGITSQDTKILGNILASKKGVLVAVNKSDLISTKEKEYIEKEILRMISFAKFAPVVFVSAKDGINITKLFKEVNLIWDSINKRITTGELNRAFRKIVEKRTPPMFKQRQVKLYYITQHNTKPPSFVLFVNKKEGVKNPYLRYVENSIREQFNLYGTPIDITINEKESRYD